MRYNTSDIAEAHPGAIPLTSCAGTRFRNTNRHVNPLEPRYVLPGMGRSASSVESRSGGGGAAAGSPRAAAVASTSPYAIPLSAVDPVASPGRLSLPRVNTAGSGSGHRDSGLEGEAAAASPKPVLLPSPSRAAAAAAAADGPSFSGAAAPQSPHVLAPNGQVTTNGAVGGLLLYGPTSTLHGNPTATAAAGSHARHLDVSDINGPRRSTSVPPRRNGGYDPLFITDIVPPRKTSPMRLTQSLVTQDIRGATVRQRTRDVPSPGRGTLVSSDIPGASPGCLTRASPTTYAIGRWPAPSVPQYHFSQGARVTALKKPVNLMD
ncbi:hypothetical protein HYH03_002349 [Edaphochlamys debaryana]|uniref:Uncharacterized protein n=1 Tax=Edaphochlamys debaryana TaxID=47281 RepID=A0A835YBV0_9CHLO|nr:hypothetical protein HYH03_002349 [Edaphochlamys debaryana]|eukprot:KAG2500072.1 hypothetical protein HYH03_002349 [Edaphochlamys debaryana]